MMPYCLWWCTTLILMGQLLEQVAQRHDASMNLCPPEVTK
jgi:hypothetical protein